MLVCVCVGGGSYETRDFFVCFIGIFPLLVVSRVDQIEFLTEQGRVTESSNSLAKASR